MTESKTQMFVIRISYFSLLNIWRMLSRVYLIGRPIIHFTDAQGKIVSATFKTKFAMEETERTEKIKKERAKVF